MRIGDIERIKVYSVLIVLSLFSVMILESQSAASFATYFLGLAVLASLSKWEDFLRLDLFWLIVVLALYLTISGFWSDTWTVESVFSVFVRALLVITFVVALADCHLRAEMQLWLGRSLALGGIIAAALSIYLFIVSPNSAGRLVGFGQLDNSVVAGLVFGVVLIFCIDRLVQEKKSWVRIFVLFSMGLLVFAIALTGSRNAAISVGCGVVVMSAAQLIKVRQTFMAVIATIFVVLGVVGLVVASTDAGAQFLFPRSDSFRIEIWFQTIDAVTESLVFGKGILTPDSVVVGAREIEHPHNMYLAVLFQGGVLGLGLFLLLLARVFYVLYQSYSAPTSKLAMGILSIAVPCYLLDGHELIDKVGETWFLFWYPVGMALGISLSNLVKPDRRYS